MITDISAAKSHILLVDDEPMILKMLFTFLTTQDYHVVCANGAQAAISVIEQHQYPFDLMITDVRMPEMDGISLMVAVRQLLPSIPVVLMTGYTDFEVVVEGLKQHAFDLLFKPIDFGQLNWCISKALAFTAAQKMEENYRIRLEEQVKKQTRQLCIQLEELREAQRKTAEVDELKREFLCLISHELRTPLNGIMGALQLMEIEDTPELLRSHLPLLRTSATKMTNLVNSLLTLVEARSRNASSGEIINTPAQLIASLSEYYREKAEEAGIRFNAESSVLSSLNLSGPWDALFSIGCCLLDNAFKFTDRGGEVNCSIRVDANIENRQQVTVVMQVTDNGKGIPQSKQKVIFQPFTQVEHYMTRSNEGAGIGLAIVRTFCDKHGGYLSLESSPGHGSTFTCRIPFKTTISGIK